MLAVFWIILTYPFSILRRRHDLALEVLEYEVIIQPSAEAELESAYIH